MTADELSAPLGQERRSKRQRAFPISASQTLVAALGLLALIFAAWALIADDPFGGEPVAVAPASLPATASGKSPEHADADPQAPRTPSRNSHDGQGADQGADQGANSLAADPPVNRIVTIIDGTSGKRQEVVIPGAAKGMDRQPARSMR